MSQTLEKKDISTGDTVYYHYDMHYRKLCHTSNFTVSTASEKPASLFIDDLVFGLIRKGVFHYVEDR